MSVGKSTQLLILGSFTTWNHIDLNQASLRLSHNHKDKVARPHNKKTNGTLRVSPRLDFIPTAGPSLLLAMQQETPKSTKGEVCSSLLGTRLAIFPHKCGFGPFLFFKQCLAMLFGSCALLTSLVSSFITLPHNKVFMLSLFCQIHKS